MLYDVHTEQIAKSAVVFVFIAAFIAAAAVSIAREFGKLKHRESARKNRDCSYVKQIM